MTRPQPPAEGLVVTFYGDDFTGSTDVMETLEDLGLPTLLFLDPPTPAEVAAHEGIRAVGVAGVGRTLSPDEMDAELPPVLEALSRLGAPLLHYKMCSTFDSAPDIGSIGRATEILRAAVGSDDAVPLVVGVPQLGRWTAFGTLFATFEGAVYRLDRHPAMTVHPITPMTEADLRVHLGAQTALPIALVDVAALDGSDDEVEERVDAVLRDEAGVVLLDVDGAGTQRQAGLALDRVIVRAAASGTTAAVVGSSGVEYALGAAWGRRGLAPAGAVRAPGSTLVVSGSRSPATQRQAEVALAAGFERVDLDPVAVTDPETGERARVDVAARAARAITERERVLVFAPPPAPGAPRVAGGDLSLALADVTRRVLARAEVSRLVVAGGDTSGHVARGLGIRALRMIRRLAPGSPLCSVVSDDPRIDGLEVCLKGGGVGGPHYFVQLAELGTGALVADAPR
ncbi:MAG: four-carbon acid sugar kinase family protein [Microbacterium enclense]